MLIFGDEEATDGIRLTYNQIPSTKEQLDDFIIPLAGIYSPLKQVELPPRMNFKPLLCTTCQAVLNPHCPIVK